MHLALEIKINLTQEKKIKTSSKASLQCEYAQ